MKLGIVLKDIGLSQIDMQHPERGNPGVGGSEFLFLLLMYYLQQQADYEIFCYHFEDVYLPQGVKERRIDCVEQALVLAKNDSVDFLVYQINWGKSWYEAINNADVKTVAWAHCYVSKEELYDMMNCPNLRRVVFVGREQYDTYIDHAIIEKSTYIYNMVPIHGNEKRQQLKGKRVTYVGSLTRGKGFHILAKEWKKILEAVPEAELYVAGSGQLYDRRCRLGKCGIAEASYENSFIRYLLDENGEILKNVHFLGIVGEEKKELFEKTCVGVINPSAKTETFGVSAVEMEAYGIPIATRGQYGLYDTVLHKKTGLLSHSGCGLRKNIICLLKDSKYNEVLGTQGQTFVKQSFTPEIIIPSWMKLFQDLKANQEAVFQKPVSHYGNDFKWVRICNRFFKKVFHIPTFPAVCDVKRTY